VGNLKLVTRVTAGEQVAVQVAELISDGRWGPGEELPGEADLPVFQYRPFHVAGGSEVAGVHGSGWHAAARRLRASGLNKRRCLTEDPARTSLHERARGGVKIQRDDSTKSLKSSKASKAGFWYKIGTKRFFQATERIEQNRAVLRLCQFQERRSANGRGGQSRGGLSTIRIQRAARLLNRTTGFYPDQVRRHSVAFCGMAIKRERDVMNRVSSANGAGEDNMRM
jgi:hypothetical protein